MKTEHHQRRNKTFPSAVVCESLTPAEFTHRVSGFSQTPKQHLLTMWVRRPRQLVLWTERREKSREGGRHSDKQHKPGLVFVFSSEPDRRSILGADADMEKLKISDINTLANITRFLQWSLKMCLSKHISMLWRQDVDCLMCSHSWKHNASFYSSHQHRGIKPKVWLWLNRRPVSLDPSELKWADDM